MAAETEAQVKFTADIKGLIQGMNESKEATEKAVAGMKGDIGSLVEAFEALGPIALAIGAVAMAFETLKESVNFMGEAVEQTNSLARSFEGLAFQIGVSYEELNNMNAAQLLSGGTSQELEGWMKSATRALRQNADMLVANGIAADKAALMSMPFTEVLKGVMAAAESIEEPAKRAIFLQESLGRAGLQSAPQIRRFIEQLENAPEVLKEYGRLIGEEDVEATVKFEEATGKGNIAMQGLKQTLGEFVRTDLVEAKEGWASFVANWSAGFQIIHSNDPSQVIKRQIEELKVETAKMAQELGEAGGPTMGGNGNAGPQQAKKKTAEELAEEKKKHDESIAIAKAAGMEKMKAAVDSASEQIKTDTTMLATEQMTFEEFVDDRKAQALSIWNAEQANAATQIKLAEGNATQIATANNTLADNKRKYYATLEGLGNENAKHEFDLMKEITANCAAEDKKYLEKREAQHDAFEKLSAEHELKTDMDVYKSRMAMMTTLSSGWDQTIQKMMNGTLSWKDGLHTALTQTGQNFEQLIIKMGLQWGMHELAKTAATQASASYRVATEEEAALKSVAIWLWAGLKNIAIKAWEAAAAAFASIAAIPVVGPFMAPLAAAGALAAVIGIGSHLASAEGGWDRVPSDQVAMIHKNEMVLPAPLAESVRNMASGGGGGGGQAIHIHAMDAQSFNHALKNNIGGLRDVLHQAVRNGRIG